MVSYARPLKHKEPKMLGSNAIKAAVYDLRGQKSFIQKKTERTQQEEEDALFPRKAGTHTNFPPKPGLGKAISSVLRERERNGERKARAAVIVGFWIAAAALTHIRW